MIFYSEIYGRVSSRLMVNYKDQESFSVLYMNYPPTYDPVFYNLRDSGTVKVGGKWTVDWHLLPKEIEEVKESLRRRIDAIRDRHIFHVSIPYTFPGDTEPDGVQLRDERDRQNIQDNMIDAQNLAPETVMYFMPTSNNVKAMTAAQMLDMGAFLKGRGDSIYAAAWTKKGEVGAATTLEELMAVDLNAGWPED